jgi:hypothetical protein
MKTVFEFDRDDITNLILAEMAEKGVLTGSGKATFEFRDVDGNPVIAVSLDDHEDDEDEDEDDGEEIPNPFDDILKALKSKRAKAIKIK